MASPEAIVKEQQILFMQKASLFSTR